MISREHAIKSLRRLADNLEDNADDMRKNIPAAIPTTRRLAIYNRQRYIQAQIRDDVEIICDLIDTIKPRRTSLKDILDFINQE
jgi:hypothetical protein